MGVFETITVSVPAEMAATLRQSVASGQYLTEGEIVRSALDDWARAQAGVAAKWVWLRDELAKADDGPWLSEDDAFAQVAAAITQHDRR